MKNTQTHVAYGIVTGLACIIFALLLQVTGWATKSNAINYVAYLLMLIGLVMNGNAYSKANKANVTFGDIYGSCFKATLIIAIIYLIWGTASLYIFPEMKTKVLEKMATSFEEQNTPEEQAQKVLDMTDKYWWLMVTVGSFLGSIITGAVLSLIAAAIPNKKTASNTL